MPDTPQDADFVFDLLSPEKRVASGPVQMVSAPGLEGEFGAGAGHAPFATPMRAGLLTLVRDEGRECFFVGGGFVEAGARRIVILADEVLPLDALNEAEIDAALRDADDDAQKARDDATRARATRTRTRLEAMKSALARAKGA